MNGNTSVVTGTYSNTEKGLGIKAEIQGFAGYMIFFFGLILFIYVIMIFAFLAADKIDFMVIPFLQFHATIMLGIPYFIVRRSVKRMKYDLLRELHYIAKK